MIEFRYDEDADTGLEVWASKEEAGRMVFQTTEGASVSLSPETVAALVSYLVAHQSKYIHAQMGGLGGCTGDSGDE